MPSFEKRVRVLEQEVAVLRAAVAARKPKKESAKKAFHSITPARKAEFDELQQALVYAAQLVQAHVEGKATDSEQAAVTLATHLRRTLEIGRAAFASMSSVQRLEMQTTIDWFDHLYKLGRW